MMTIDEFIAYPNHGGLSNLVTGDVKTKQGWVRAYFLDPIRYDSVDQMIASLTPTSLGWGSE